jgi:hypothetical protein
VTGVESLPVVDTGVKDVGVMLRSSLLDHSDY